MNPIGSRLTAAAILADAVEAGAQAETAIRNLQAALRLVTAAIAVDDWPAAREPCRELSHHAFTLMTLVSGRVEAIGVQDAKFDAPG